MDIVSAVISITEVTIRTSSKLWKLSTAWRDAPEDLHRLRDDITRTHQFFDEVRHNARYVTALGSEKRSVARPGFQRKVPMSRSDLPGLLDEGAAVLGRIEDFVDGLENEHGEGRGESHELGKRRRLNWIRHSTKVARMRKELSNVVSSICHLLITQNV